VRLFGKLLSLELKDETYIPAHTDNRFMTTCEMADGIRIIQMPYRVKGRWKAYGLDG
jgi:hypothetical protein